MNLKLAKRLRRQINETTKPYGLSVRYVEYATLGVPSRKGTSIKNVETGEVIKDSAIQLRMKLGCPRQIYKGLKKHVRDTRTAA